MRKMSNFPSVKFSSFACLCMCVYLLLLCATWQTCIKSVAWQMLFDLKCSAMMVITQYQPTLEMHISHIEKNSTHQTHQQMMLNSARFVSKTSAKRNIKKRAQVSHGTIASTFAKHFGTSASCVRSFVCMSVWVYCTSLISKINSQFPYTLMMVHISVFSESR